jgi:hypothetical protein
MAVLGSPPTRPSPAGAEHEIRFCRGADGVRIAYAVHGSGPPLVVSKTGPMLDAWRERCPIYLSLLRPNEVELSTRVVGPA